MKQSVVLLFCRGKKILLFRLKDLKDDKKKNAHSRLRDFGFYNLFLLSLRRNCTIDLINTEDQKMRELLRVTDANNVPRFPYSSISIYTFTYYTMLI
jgi:hypothetical protein